MIKKVIEFLIGNWEKYLPDMKRPEKVSFLQLCGDADYRKTEKIEVFLFFNGEKIPSLVVNLGRDPEYTEILQNEYTALKKLHAISSIPRPILHEKIGTAYALIITHLTGRTMEQMTIKKNQAEKKAEPFLRMMTEWLVNLNCNTLSDSINIYPYAENLLNEYLLYYPSHKPYLTRMLDSMKDISVKATFTHGNPAAGNILVDGEKLRLVDWAVAREKGLPLSDLLIFLTWYGLNFFRTGDFLKSYKMTFFDSNRFSNTVKEVVYSYCEKVNIDRKFILPLFYLTWIEYAVRKFRFMAINGGCQGSLFSPDFKIDSPTVQGVWDNFPHPNQSLPLLHISNNRPANIQMLFDGEKKFIL